MDSHVHHLSSGTFLVFDFYISTEPFRSFFKLREANLLMKVISFVDDHLSTNHLSMTVFLFGKGNEH